MFRGKNEGELARTGATHTAGLQVGMWPTSAFYRKCTNHQSLDTDTHPALLFYHSHNLDV